MQEDNEQPKVKNNVRNNINFMADKIEEGENWYVIRQVMINRAFYNSQQWIAYNNKEHYIYVPDLRPGEKRLTFNKIKPAVLTLQSKLSKNRVKLEVKPDTNDVSRIETAKAGLKYLKWVWNDNEMDKKSRRLKFHMIVDGFPTLKVYVDKEKGKSLKVPDELKGEVDEDDAPTAAGQICTLVKDQFSILVDPNAESEEEIKWCIDRTPEDVDDIFKVWKKRVSVESNIALRQSFDTGYNGNIAIGREIKKFKHHAFVNDFWQWPCPEYPKGRRIVTAGDQTLYESTDPGPNPYIFFPAVPVPGSAVATGVVTDMTTPQRSYNIKRTAEARILEEMGNPMWINPNGATEDDELVNEIGGILHSAGQDVPVRVAGIEPGNGWQAAMERDEADMEDISGAHEISQGAEQKGNTTLGGLQLQVEQDETKLALLVQSYEDGIKKWGQRVLELVSLYFPEEQQLSIVGDNGEVEAFTFIGEDLTGGEIVDVVPGSSMPTLKAVQDEKIMAMWSAGMFVDPSTGMPDSRKVMTMLGEPIANEYFDDREQDRNRALMEQLKWEDAFSEENWPAMQQYLIAKQAADQEAQVFQDMSMQATAEGIDPAQLPQPQPAPPPPFKLPIVRDFYDHQVHIEEHNRFRKGDEYDELPPEAQGLIDQHVAEHMQYLQAPMMQAQQQEQAAVQQQTDAAGKAEADKAAQAAEQADKQAAQAAADKEADRQHQARTQANDHYNKMEQETVKAQTALEIANMRGGSK